MNPVISSGFARLASFAPTAAATLLTSHIIISRYGVGAFGNFAVILSLIYLLPLSDLGVGAAVTTAYAADGASSPLASRTVLTAARVLALSTAATALVAGAITVAHLWPTLLGAAAGPNTWCGIAIVIFALSFVPGLGQSLLLGAHKNHVTVLIQTLFNPLLALLVGVAALTRQPGPLLIVMPCIALVIVNVIMAHTSARITGLSWSTTLRRLPARRRHPGARIRGMAGPVLILSLATPIALQSDRLILSHVATGQDVAQYSVAMQVFAPALTLMAATAQPLWPIYTAARGRGERGPNVVRTVTLFGAASAALGLVLALLVIPVSRLIGGSDVHVGALLAVSGALVVATSGLAYPVAMSLMDPAGVRVVVKCTVVALPLNLALSVVLGARMGAPGPLLATATVGLLVQVLPALMFSADRYSAGRHRRARTPRRVAEVPRPAQEVPVAF